MSRFIKLSNVILNINSIQKITIHPNKYYIHFITKSIGGNSLMFFNSGWGTLTSTDDTITICEKENPADYKTVTDWIGKME